MIEEILKGNKTFISIRLLSLRDKLKKKKKKKRLQTMFHIFHNDTDWSMLGTDTKKFN